MAFINRLLDEYDPNHGLIFLATGSAQIYAMNGIGQAYTEQGNTAVPAADRETFYHPDLMLTGSADHASIQSFMQGGIDFAVESRATRYSLTKPSTTLPVTLALGVPYLSNPQPLGDLIESFAVRRARSSLDAKIDISVNRDQSSDLENPEASRNFFYPMEIIELQDRCFGVMNPLRYVTVGMAVVDGDHEKRQRDISAISLQCRDPALYGLVSSFEGKLAALKIPVPAVPPTPPALGGVGLSRRDSNAGYWIFYYADPVTLEQYRNWVADPAPTLWVQKGTSKKFYSANDQVQFKHGLGEIWIEKSFFAESTANEGMGNPTFGPTGNLRLNFLRWASPLDNFQGSLPLNVAMATVLKDAGYQHIEDSGFLYMKSIPPVLADFVFDQVAYDPASGGNLDLTTTVQNESGAPLQINTPVLNHVGDALYFKLNQANGRFNWIYFIPYQPAIGGSYVWEIETGGSWTAITPYTGVNDPEAWLRGATDGGADQLQNGGLITFKESQLATWTISAQDFGFGPPATDGFYMRVRCTGAPTQAPILHRWAGKEVLTVGKDKQSIAFRHYDENHHFELCQQMLHRWGVPNYYLTTDRFGDVMGQYLVQKGAEDYTLTELDTIEIARDGTQVYTEVRVLVKAFDNEGIKDYASLLEGGVPSHPTTGNAGIAFVDQDGDALNTNTYYVTNVGAGSSDPRANTIKLQMPIDGSVTTDWGLRYERGNGHGRVDISQLLGIPVYQVDFVTTISVMGLQIRMEPTMVIDVEGFNPDTSTWSVLPGCSNLGGRGPGEDVGPAYTRGPIDFTSDPNPDRPVASKIRVILRKIRASDGKKIDGVNHYGKWDFWFYQLKCFGVAQGEVLEGVAILGTTPPFNTAADVATMSRYGRRVFAVQNNPYITTKKEADRVALEILRELARLYDPLVVTGIYPLAEIGETVRVVYAQMGINQTYLVEEVDRSPMLELRALLTPYRFSALAPPTVLALPDRTVVAAGPLASCLPSAAAGDDLPTGTLIWNYDASEGLTLDGPEVTVWLDLSGHNRTLNRGLEVGPQSTGGRVQFNGHTTIGDGDVSRWAGVSQPVHRFLVYRQEAGEWVDGTVVDSGIFGMVTTQHGSTGQLALNGGDDTHFIYLSVPVGAAFHVVEHVTNGANSKAALDGGAFVIGDTGVPSNSSPRGYNIASPPNTGAFGLQQSLGYQGELSPTDRAAVVAGLKIKWGIP